MLEAINIKKSYDHLKNTLDVLKGVNIKIDQGEFLSIIGPSGAGKSTLLHIMGALDSPSDGKIIIDEEDVYKLNDTKRANLRNQKIGFVFQFYHLLPEFTALENVLLPVLIKEDRSTLKDFEQKGMEYLDQVGLKNRAQHKPQELSGGEQQRVAIARALINEPKLVLCDEPTGNLDSKNGGEIIDLLVSLNKRNNQTLVIVTHDESIAKASHRTIHLHDGHLK